MTWDCIVIGAGAAGILAATRAAERGKKTLLLEKNKKPGVKILMSGGTRCNLTHDCDRRGIVEAYGQQGKFLHSALAALGPREVVQLVEDEGCPTKVEETGKVFPVSNRAVDILAAFMGRCERSGATVALSAGVTAIEPAGEGWLVRTNGGEYAAAKVIVTSGGKSYPGCGTTGDGYPWAAKLGHTIVPTKPALVPITVDVDWLMSVRGLTIPDTGVRIVTAEDVGKAKAKPLATARGSLLFAHFGLSGPAGLDPSRAISGHPSPRSLRVVLDFCPNRTAESLVEDLRQQGQQQGKKQITNTLPPEILHRLGEHLCHLAAIPLDRKASELSKVERQRLVEHLKAFVLPVKGTLGFEKAEVTAGGVSLAEVDSRTMESKLRPNLYFAGEVLDLDGPIGGYNFQAAFSTGWLAGTSV